MTNKCECCGRAYPQSKVRKPYVSTLTRDERAAMSDPQFYAYCKKIAVHGDAQFFLTHGEMSDARRLEVQRLRDELAMRKSTPADVKQLIAWKDELRTANPAREFTFARKRRLQEERDERERCDYMRQCQAERRSA